jgi:hypothetical protein
MPTVPIPQTQFPKPPKPWPLPPVQPRPPAD